MLWKAGASRLWRGKARVGDAATWTATRLKIGHLRGDPATPVAEGFIAVVIAEFDVREAVIGQREMVLGVVPGRSQLPGGRQPAQD